MDSTLVISLEPLRLWGCRLTSSRWAFLAAILLFYRIGSISTVIWTQGIKEKGRKRLTLQDMAYLSYCSEPARFGDPMTAVDLLFSANAGAVDHGIFN